MGWFNNSDDRNSRDTETGFYFETKEDERKFLKDVDKRGDVKTSVEHLMWAPKGNKKVGD